MENKIGVYEAENNNPAPVVAMPTNPPPPYQPGYAPVQQPVGQTVIIQPVINQVLHLGKHPSPVVW